MRFGKIIVFVFLLIGLDMAIRIAVATFWMDVRFNIIPGLLEFKPVVNHAYSYVSGLFGLGIGYWLQLLIDIFVVGLFLFLYAFIRRYGSPKRMADAAIVLLLSGALCALIIQIVWGYCLDYIYLVPLFVFDMKDLCLSTGAVLLPIALMRDEKLREIKWRHFAAYSKSLFNKNRD